LSNGPPPARISPKSPSTASSLHARAARKCHRFSGPADPLSRMGRARRRAPRAGARLPRPRPQLARLRRGAGKTHRRNAVDHRAGLPRPRRQRLGGRRRLLPFPRLRFRSRLRGARIRLIGHSMGGTISLLYSGAFPERVSRLMLIEGIGPPGMTYADAPARMVKWIAEVRERGRRHFRQYTSIEAGAGQLRQTNPRLPADFALELARAAMRQTSAGKWVWKFDPLHRTAAPQ